MTLLPQIQVSELDSKRFTIKVERLSITNEDQISDGGIIELCRAMSGDLLILRAPSSRIALGSQLLKAEMLDAFQADTLVYFAKMLEDAGLPFSESPGVLIRKSIPSDKEDVGSVARVAFENYPNHYLANQRLELVKGLKAPLAGFRLVWGISGIEFAAHGEGIDSGGNKVVVGASPKETDKVVDGPVVRRDASHDPCQILFGKRARDGKVAP